MHLLSLAIHVGKGLPGPVEDGHLARGLLPAMDCDINKRWRDLHRTCAPVELLRCDDLAPTSRERFENTGLRLGVLLHRDLEEAEGLGAWVFVPHRSELPVVVHVPDRVDLPLTMSGLVSTAPAKGTGLVSPVEVGVAEGRRWLHPDNDLMEEEAVALEDFRDDRLLEMSVPDVDSGVFLEEGETLQDRAWGAAPGRGRVLLGLQGL